MISKIVNGEQKTFANVSLENHNLLSGRNAPGCHPIAAIRKLPEKLTALKEGQTQIGVISGDDDCVFINYRGDETVIYKLDTTSLIKDSSGNITLVNKADNITLVVDDNTKTISAVALNTDDGVAITGGYINDSLIALRNSVNGLGGYLDATNFGTASPTQTQLTNYALEQIPGISDPSEIFNQTKVTNLYNGHIWILTNTPNSDPPVFEWADNGQAYVGVATNTMLGIVKGSYENLQATIDVDGHISINGLQTALNNKVDKINTLGEEAYTHNGSTQTSIPISTQATNNSLVKRDSTGKIVATTPTTADPDNTVATVKFVADNGGKIDTITYNGSVLPIEDKNVSINASVVTVSATGTAADVVRYITVDGTEKKLSGGVNVRVID